MLKHWAVCQDCLAENNGLFSAVHLVLMEFGLTSHKVELLKPEITNLLGVLEFF
jgi:hypothetical protein